MESKHTAHDFAGFFTDKVHWHGERRYLPGPEFVVRATVTARLRFLIRRPLHSPPVSHRRSRTWRFIGASRIAPDQALLTLPNKSESRYSCREHCCSPLGLFVGNIARRCRIKSNVQYWILV